MDKASKKIRKRVSQHANFTYQILRSRIGASDHNDIFEKLSAFCIFVGYPRSGSTLVASMLGAHPDVVLGHEADVLGHIRWGSNASQIYDVIMRESKKFASRGNAWEGYEYEIPDQWQGRCRKLKVLGDKEAAMTSVRLYKHPELLKKLRERIPAPIRVIHVVRSPLDNITTMFRRGRYPILRLPLERAVRDFERMCIAVDRIRNEVEPGELHEIHHEALLQDPAGHLRKLCGFLNIEAPEDYLRDCSAIVNPVASKSRNAIKWSDENIERVKRIIRDFPSHGSYGEDTHANAEAAIDRLTK